MSDRVPSDCLLSSWMLRNIHEQRWGSPGSFSNYKRLKLKLRVFLAGHVVAMVTYCAIQLTTTCSSMIGQFFDTMILVSTDIEWF